VLTAVAVALGSAAFFALGSALQHRAAGEAPDSSARRMIGGLLRRPQWLLGGLGCAVAFGLQAVALRLGTISAVQPVLLTGIVFTVVVRAALDRRLPRRAELGWVVLTWLGLAIFIVALPRAPEQPARTGTALIMVAVGLVLVGAVALLTRRLRARPVLRGVLLAAASGVLFGLVAGLLKLTAGAVSDGIGALFGQWSLWALIVVGIAAVLLNQRAYQQTRMSVSTPVLNIVQLLVSLAFGALVLAEPLFATPANVAGELAGLVIMVVGISMLTERAATDHRLETRAETASR
jgi:drug/metabolite transporter (DMT)-like permease